MFEFMDFTKDNVIAIRVSGKIEAKDYEKLTPVIEKTEREGKPVRLFLRLEDVEGMTGLAILKDIATYFKHAKKMEKVAVVGEGDYNEDKWAKVATPFVKADVKYFPVEKQVIAEDWIKK